MNSSKKNNLFVIWIAAFLIYLLLQPYFIWKYASLMNWLVNLPLYIIFLLNADKKNTGSTIGFLFIALVAALVSNNSILGTFFFILGSTIFLADKSFLTEIYEKFRTIYVVTISISMVVMLLVLLGISIPSEIITPVNQLKSHNYIAYPFFVIPTNSILTAARFCGLFDEPGVIGTTAAIFMYIEKFNLKRKGNIIILISGILSVSLFFYAYITIFFVYKFFSTKMRFFYRLLSIVVFAFSVVFIINNEITNELIVARLEWDADEKTISGDNRSSEDLDYYVNSIRWSEAYFFGVNDPNVLNRYSTSASLQNVIIRYGFIVLLMYFIFYVFYAKKHIGLNMQYLFFLCSMFLFMYNRPELFNLCRNFLLVIAVNNYSLYASTRNNKLAIA